MTFGSLFEAVSPYARVSTAVAPFVVAMALRFAIGKNRLTGGLVTLSTMWFLVNVLIAPYSFDMQQELQRLFH